MAFKVKGLGMPIRTTLTHDLVSCRMYSSLDQLVRGWSRILYDALDRKTWRLVAKLTDPLIFCQSGHIALIASLVLLYIRPPDMFLNWLLAISLVHHLLMYIVLRRIYRMSDPTTRHVAFYPLANLVVDVILVRSIWMCLTGRVTWRGTVYPKTWSSSIQAPEK